MWVEIKKVKTIITISWSVQNRKGKKLNHHLTQTIKQNPILINYLNILKNKLIRNNDKIEIK